MRLSYTDLRMFDTKLDTIITGIEAIRADQTERSALRAEIQELIDASNLLQTEKDALNARVAAALQRTEVIESKARSVLP